MENAPCRPLNKECGKGFEKVAPAYPVKREACFAYLSSDAVYLRTHANGRLPVRLVDGGIEGMCAQHKPEASIWGKTPTVSYEIAKRKVNARFRGSGFFHASGMGSTGPPCYDASSGFPPFAFARNFFALMINSGRYSKCMRSKCSHFPPQMNPLSSKSETMAEG